MGWHWKNHFLFLLPPIIWNLVFTPLLPMDHFLGEAPFWVVLVENLFRIITFTLPLFLPVVWDHKRFRTGLKLYTVGLLLYFGSWMHLMISPDSSLAGLAVYQLAPAFTPMIWLAGMSMMSRSRFYGLASFFFISFHVMEYVFRLMN